jgi:hypothetical protein
LARLQWLLGRLRGRLRLGLQAWLLFRRFLLWLLPSQ